MATARNSFISILPGSSSSLRWNAVKSSPIVSLFPWVFTHLLRWNIWRGIAGSRRMCALPSLGPQAGEGKLNSSGGSLWEQEASLLLFFLPICFLCLVPSDVGSLARKTFILRCEGCVRAPMGRQNSRSPGFLLELAAQRHCCSLVVSWQQAQQGSWHRVRRGKPVLSHLCVSFTYLPLLPYVGEAWIWEYCRNLISS